MKPVGPVVIVDTTVLLNLLNVPGFNEATEVVDQEFRQFSREDGILMLPLATVFETGNHIADVGRHDLARLFCDQVKRC